MSRHYDEVAAGIVTRDRELAVDLIALIYRCYANAPHVSTPTGKRLAGLQRALRDAVGPGS